MCKKLSKENFLVEIEPDSKIKLEYLDGLKYDRNLLLRCPAAYGTFPKSKLQGDNDTLDGFILKGKTCLNEELTSEAVYELEELKIVGKIILDDTNQQDNKYLFLLAKDYDSNYNYAYSHELDTILNYLLHYKLHVKSHGQIIKKDTNPISIKKLIINTEFKKDFEKIYNGETLTRRIEYSPSEELKLNLKSELGN